jgi:uracil-DNA glycosylase family 4
MAIGLFTREEMKQGNHSRRGKLPPMSAERLHTLGLRGVVKMNPGARHPDMPATGASKPLLYILGEAPGEEEDKHAKQFIGKSGELLRKYIPERYAERIRWNNVVRTRPPKNRKPEFHEVECFRPSLIADIEAAKPRAILGCGAVPLDWMLGKTKGIKVCRGRRFPVRVGSHACWFYPVLHPSFVLRVEKQQETGGGREDNIPGKEWKNAFVYDVARVFAELKHLEQPEIIEPATLFENVEIVKSGGVDRIIRFLKKMHEEKRVAIDLETNRLRPYEAGAKILCCAVGTVKHTLAFPLGHASATYSPAELKRVLDALHELLIAPNAKIAHHAQFEMEWLAWQFDVNILRQCPWHCTVAQAYILDERKGGHSLNFLTMQRMGVRLKEQLNVITNNKLFGVAVEEEGGVDRSKLEHVELGGLLKYCGGDTKVCHTLDRVQRAEIKEQGLTAAYRLQIRRIPTIVLAQAQGVPVDPKQVRKFERRFDKAKRVALRKIKRLPCVAKYEKRFGKFNLDSPKQMVVMFRDILHRKEIVRGKSYSTDEAVLETIDHPLSRLVLQLRKATKLRRTYVEPLKQGTPKSVVFPDGKLHTIFNTTLTATGRLSSEKPNMQNFPKRENVEVRSMICAAAGWTLIAADYGALEARMIACASRDKRLVDALRTDYDIHTDWAKRIAARCPEAFKPYDGDWKAWRNDVKNSWVFAGFYGSSFNSMAASLHLPQRAARRLHGEFWDEFRGVKNWQDGTVEFYEEHRYIEFLTGRRRRAPMNYNMLINGNPQGSGSDIVVTAMNEMSEEGQRRGKLWLSPVLDVHDDLTMCVPDKRVDSSIELLVRTMCGVSFPWLIVPLLVEVSKGKNWADMQPVGKFKTGEL